MEHNRFPLLRIDTKLAPQTIELRKKSPTYFAKVTKQLHDAGIFENIQSIDDIQRENVSPLEGGKSSATYLVRDAAKNKIIKFRAYGGLAEKTWLNAASSLGVEVPRVEFYGVVEDELIDGGIVTCTVLSEITDEKGERAKRVADYSKQPAFLSAISHQAGIQLAKLHSGLVDAPFGGFEEARRFATWAEYIDQRLGYRSLFQAGIKIGERNAIMLAIRSIPFPVKGGYIHGDFGKHNLLVRSPHPPDVVIIDPNPMVADPFYDIATQYNNREVKKALHMADPENEYRKTIWDAYQIYFENLMRGYKETTGQEIDPRRLAANQLFTLVESIKQEKNRDERFLVDWEKKKKNTEKKIKLNLIREKVNYLVGDQSQPKNSTSILSLIRDLTRRKT